MAIRDARKHTRISLWAAAVLFLDGGITLSGRAENPSFGGVFLKTDPAEATEGESGTLELSPAGNEGSGPIRFLCQVVRLEPRGLGLQLTQTDLESYERFRSFILQDADDPDALLDELRVTPGLRVATGEGLKKALE